MLLDIANNILSQLQHTSIRTYNVLCLILTIIPDQIINTDTVTGMSDNDVVVNQFDKTVKYECKKLYCLLFGKSSAFVIPDIRAQRHA